MKIALINENSQAPKNELIFQTLKKAVEPMGHTCYNYGRYSAEDVHQRTYVQAGLLTALLLNSGAADFVITGCGTGMGATLACNAFPGVMCGRVNDPCDAYLFSQVNNGNAVAMPFAFQFGCRGESAVCFREAVRHGAGRRLSPRVGGGGAEQPQDPDAGQGDHPYEVHRHSEEY